MIFQFILKCRHSHSSGLKVLAGMLAIKAASKVSLVCNGLEYPLTDVSSIVFHTNTTDTYIIVFYKPCYQFIVFCINLSTDFILFWTNLLAILLFFFIQSSLPVHYWLFYLCKYLNCNNNKTFCLKMSFLKNLNLLYPR